MRQQARVLSNERSQVEHELHNLRRHNLNLRSRFEDEMTDLKKLNQNQKMNLNLLKSRAGSNHILNYKTDNSLAGSSSYRGSSHNLQNHSSFVHPQNQRINDIIANGRERRGKFLYED